MTTVSIVTAFNGRDDLDRRVAYDYCCSWYGQLGWEIVIDSSPGGKAAAVNAGVEQSTGNVIVQLDMDSLVPYDRLREAVDLAAEADGLVVPHDRYLYLTADATADIYVGDGWASKGPGDCESFGQLGVGNVVVFSRRTFDTVGGFDPRFKGWGGDDAAFAIACWGWFGDTRRLPGDVVHLWHSRPASQRMGINRYGHILGEYTLAGEQGPEAVRALVEARCRS